MKYASYRTSKCADIKKPGGTAEMVHGYHVIVVAYGFWLPNDPRGSWSDFVGSWELRRFGPPTKSLERQMKLSDPAYLHLSAARRAMNFPPVQFTGQQARSIGIGISNAVRRSCFTVWACSILPEHIHLVIERHRYKIEQVVRLIKGAATNQLLSKNLHPLAEYRNSHGKTPSPWADRKWKVFLDTEAGIENAIRYVEENPAKEGKRPQRWNFVTPFTGLESGWTTYHN